MSGVRDAWVDSGFPIDFGAVLAGFASDAMIHIQNQAAAQKRMRWSLNMISIKPNPGFEPRKHICRIVVARL